MDNIKLELVKIARDLCFTEYTDRRAQLHNKWLVESEHLWRTQRLRLAYPDMPVYPGEADILTRAEKLYEYINNKPLVLTATVEPVSTPDIVTEAEPEIEAENIPVPEPMPTQESPPEPPDNVIELKQPEPQADSGAGQTPAAIEPQPETAPAMPERPKTSMEKRQEAEAKLLELIKEQSKLQSMPKAEATTATRLLPGIINKLTDIKNSLATPGPPKGGS